MLHGRPGSLGSAMGHLHIFAQVTSTFHISGVKSGPGVGLIKAPAHEAGLIKRFLEPRGGTHFHNECVALRVFSSSLGSAVRKSETLSCFYQLRHQDLWDFQTWGAVPLPPRWYLRRVLYPRRLPVPIWQIGASSAEPWLDLEASDHTLFFASG